MLDSAKGWLYFFCITLMDNRIPSGDVYQPAINRGWWVIRVNGIYIALFFLWTQFHWGGEQHQVLIGNLAFIPVEISWIAMWWRTAMYPALSRRARWGWRLLTAGALCYGIASSIIWNYLELVLQQQPYPSMTNSQPVFEWYMPLSLTLYVVFPLLFCGFILITEAFKSRAELFKFFLDTGIVLVGLGTPVWYFLMRPIVETYPNVSEMALLLQYPATTLVLLFIALIILFKSSGSRDNSPLQWLALAMLVACIADIAFNHLIQEYTYQTGDPIDTLYLVADLLLMTGAQWEYVRASTGSPARLPHEQYNPFQSLPYPAVLAAYGLLLAVTFDYWRNPWQEPLGGLIFAAVLLTMLLIIRQLIVYEENLQLRIAQVKHENEAHFAALVRQSSDLIAITNPQGVIRFVSPAAWNLLGYHASQLEMISWLTLLHPEDQNRGCLFFQDTLQHTGANGVIEWRVRRCDQSWMYAETVASNRLDDPTILGIVLNSRDISERRALEQQIWQQAHYDSLTQLANRVLFRDRIEHAVQRAQRHHQPLAVMFLDLDNFKTINDHLGHSAGDQLLVDTAHRLVRCIRTSDTAARLGGDEFAVLIEDAPSFDDVTQLAERMLDTLCIPFTLAHGDVLVTASIGIVIDTGKQDVDALLSNADKAMYAAKSRGKQCYAFFEPATDLDPIDIKGNHR